MSKHWQTVASESILKLAILYFSFGVSLSLMRLLRLSFPHKYGVESPATFYPESNYLVLLAIIAATISLYLLLELIRTRNSRFFRFIITATIIFFYFIGVMAPHVAEYVGNIDSFHHGEQLAPGLAFMEGKVPYKDIFFLHGAGEDVIAPRISFALFGTSIGSYFLFSSLLQLTSISLFCILLGRLLKNDAWYLVFLFWFMSGAFAAFYYIRDIPIWISLILLHSFILSRYRRVVFGCFGFIAAFTLFYSLDRGIFLHTLLALVLSTAIFLERTSHGAFAIKKPSLREAVYKMLPVVIGYAIGLLTWLIILGWSGLVAFVTTSFEVTKYQGAIFNYPYLEFGQQTLVAWMPVIALSVTGILLVRQIHEVCKGKRPYIFPPMLVLNLILFIFALVFFRAATGRPDIGHVAYGSVVIFLLFTSVFTDHLTRRATNIRNLPSWLPESLPILLVALLLFSNRVVDYTWFTQNTQKPLNAARLLISAPKKPDTFWTNDEYERLVEYIKAHTKSSDTIFVFPSEPLIYYSTQRPNATNFYISWFADPTTLEEKMLEQLQANRPKLIIYSSGYGFYDAPDYYSMQHRLPLVNKWILDNYTNKTIVGNQTILTMTSARTTR